MVVVTNSNLETQSQPVLPEKSEAQISCEAKGGKWENNACILPEKEAPADTRTGAEKEFEAKFGSDFKSFDRVGFLNEKEKIRQEQGVSGRIAEQQLTASPAEVQAKLALDQAQQDLLSEQPERRELSPELSLGEKVPVLGGVIGALSDAIRPFKKKLGFKTTEPLQAEELRTVALTQIEKEEIERGLTASETFGKFAEAVGLGSIDFFGISTKGLVETPSENTIEAVNNIRKEKRRLTNIETNVKLGYLPIEVAQDQVVDIENNIQRLDSRIRMLISNSPELKFNSDGVNTIETEILAANEKIFQAKSNILTGASQNPAEVQILMKLQELGIAPTEEFEL